jgi:N6-L-threonylcarbamoyladenine synthase
MANWLVEDMQFPCVVLVVSGGHTQLFLMSRIGVFEELGNTRDDAAGEAFDKVGKMLGIPYPAGPVFEKLAKRGDPNAIAFVRARLKDGAAFDFSFSGLKTAARLQLEAEGLVPATRLQPLGSGSSGDRTPAELDALPQRAYDILASAQEAIVDMLVAKTQAAVQATRVQHIYLAGGVAANTRLRDGLRAALEPQAALHVPPPRLCTDNAAMIACVGHFRLQAGAVSGYDANAFARGPLQSWGAALAGA